MIKVSEILQVSGDSFTSSNAPTINNGTSNSLVMTTTGYLLASHLIFTETIPSHIKRENLISATLFLRNASSDTFTEFPDMPPETQSVSISVSTLDSVISETQTTWNNRLTATPWVTAGHATSADLQINTTSSETITHYPSIVNMWIPFDVTLQTQHAIASDSYNLRIVVRITTPITSYTYYSSEYSDAAFRPYIKFDLRVGLPSPVRKGKVRSKISKPSL